MKYTKDGLEFSLEVSELRIESILEDILAEDTDENRNNLILEKMTSFVAKRELESLTKFKIVNGSATDFDGNNVNEDDVKAKFFSRKQLCKEKKEIIELLNKLDAQRMKSLSNYLIEEKIYTEDKELSKTKGLKGFKEDFECRNSVIISACEELIDDISKICFEKLISGEFTKIDYFALNKDVRSKIKEIKRKRIDLTI